MTASLFTERLDEVFIPGVKQNQKSLGKEGGKVFLIVDNAPTQPTEELLGRQNGKFTRLGLRQTSQACCY